MMDGDNVNTEDNMTTINIALAFLILLIIPSLVGLSVVAFFKLDRVSLSMCFLVGTFSTWAIFQVVSVPMILLKSSFHLLEIVVACILIFLIVFGCICLKKRPVKIIFFPRLVNWSERILFVFLVLLLSVVLYFVIAYQHIDDDDARFVVNAIEMLRTDKMFLTNPGTGLPIEIWSHELTRDVASPWAAYQAYVSQLTICHPTILMHTIQPIALFLLSFCVVWDFSQTLVGDSISSRLLFCIIVWVVILYGDYNAWTAERFLLGRTWQGKSIVAGIGIPYLTSSILKTYSSDKKSLFLVVVVINTALCLLSNMGSIVTEAIIPLIPVPVQPAKT